MNHGVEAFVRPRTEDDLDACERMARVVRETDGYPVYLPGHDFRRFIASPQALAAWVAADRKEIVGQVALHRSSSEPVMSLAAAAIGVDAERIVVVARLVVAPAARRKGVGRLLFDAAVVEAERRGLVPILDVVTGFTGAIALYESAGWTRLGTVDLEFSDGTAMSEHVYVPPRPTP